MAPIHSLLPLLLLTGLARAAPPKSGKLTVSMPDVRPTVNDQVLCFAKKVEHPLFITSFRAKAHMDTAHHILMYGCAEPGIGNAKAWNCGEMSSKTSSPDFEEGDICKDGQSRILYAWAMDAPGLKLPKGVGFPVGQKGAEYLVIQVHYKNASKFIKNKAATDRSAVEMDVQTSPTPKIGGVFLVLTGGIIPPHSTVHMEADCRYGERVTLHPFAFRTHAHKLGKVVAGYRIRHGKWTEIGRKSPQLPQMFYDISHRNMTIRYGDRIAARCVMKNSGDNLVAIGSTQNDEMCNFYMMYWVPAKDARVINDEKASMCFSLGWPLYKWTDAEGTSKEAIPKSAAMVPGSTQELKETADRELYAEALEQSQAEPDEEPDELEQELNDELGRGEEEMTPEYDPEEYEWVR